MKAERIIVLFLFLLFYIGENLYAKFKMPIDYGGYLRILIVFALVIYLHSIRINNFLHNNNMLLALVLVLIRLITIGVDGVVTLFTLFCGPLVICAIINKVFKGGKVLTQKKIVNLLFVFYVIECIFAITEKIAGIHILGWTDSEGSIVDKLTNEEGFRSAALLGHPLQNALMVSTIMSFILFSNIRFTVKIGLWILGYFSILCFNTRSSMVGNAIVLTFYMAYYAFHGGKNGSRWKTISLGFILIVGIILLLTKTSLGGRLATMGLVDDSSAQVRIDVWRIFDYYDLNSFLWGNHSEMAEYIVDSIGLVATENFWIDWMLHFGLAEILIYLFMVKIVVSRLYCGYDRINIIVTAGTFWLISSTNNSLSFTYVPMALYLLCIIVFNPAYFFRFPKILK